MHPRFDEELRIPGYLCNTTDRLSLPGMAALFQEAAWTHADLLGFSFVGDEIPVYWVLSRITVEVARMPRWNERITVRTWPSGTHRLFATREYVIERNDEPIITGASSWIILDSRSGRPVRPAEYLEGRPTPDEHALEQDFARITPLETSCADDWKPVPPTALDRNLHVNNTRYVEWFVNWAHGSELAPFVDDPSGRRFVMTYTAETLLGDQYRVCGDPASGASDVRIRRPERTAESATGSTAGEETTAWSLRLR